MNVAQTIRCGAKWSLFAVLGLALVNRLPLAAHDSPEHEIEALTSRMSKVGKTASLLMRRATEFKALGELDKAAADLAEAISLEPKSPAAYAELSRVQFAQGKLGEAGDNATRSLTLMEEAGERGAVFLLRAQIQAARGRIAEALSDCELADRKDDLDWYLTRSQIQRQLGKLDARVAGLKDGFARNGSIVLEIEWIEAMIDAGQNRQALEMIDQHLNQLRLRSSWLLRRARALKGLKADFQNEAKAALAELERRIRPEHPEPTLLLDRATAWALLGDEKAAREDLKAAQKHGIPASSCERVESLLNASKLVADTTAVADKQKTSGRE